MGIFRVSYHFDRHPGHFTRLADGRMLLSYGNRITPRGVDARISDDEGETWSEAVRVTDFSGGIERHDGYHMGVVIWDPTTTFAK